MVGGHSRWNIHRRPLGQSPMPWKLHRYPHALRSSRCVTLLTICANPFSLHDGSEPLLFDLLEGQPRGRMHCGLAGRCLPTADRDIDVAWIDFHPAGRSPRPLSSDDGRAGAGEGIQDDAVVARAVLDSVGDHARGLYGRMHRQFFEPSRAKTIDAGVIPDIGPIAPVLSELEVVDVP